MTVDEAAVALGISPDAVRKRLVRGRLVGHKVAGVWTVDLDSAPDNRPGQTGQADKRGHANGLAMSDLLDQLRSENAFLREQLVEAATERSELRRMLNLEQQTVAALAPPTTLLDGAQDVPTLPETGESGLLRAEVAQNGAAAESLSQALKDAGVKGKKTRRRLLSRLAAAWRGT
jgi:hypothetical protein